MFPILGLLYVYLITHVSIQYSRISHECSHESEGRVKCSLQSVVLHQTKCNKRCIQENLPAVTEN